MNKISYVSLIFSLIVLVSCGSTGNVVSKPQRHNPNFDYTPPQRANPASAEITIALINPVFAENDPNKLVPPYSTFIENMADDFEEMLIAKGFSLRGPFVSRDEMVYGDKTNSDIALEINCQGVETWTGKPTPTQMLSLDVGIYNPIAKALEEYYREAIKTAWRHIDVEEMELIKKEIVKSKN